MVEGLTMILYTLVKLERGNPIVTYQMVSLVGKLNTICFIISGAKFNISEFYARILGLLRQGLINTSQELRDQSGGGFLSKRAEG